jgi:hypothetical protein
LTEKQLGGAPRLALFETWAFQLPIQKSGHEPSTPLMNGSENQELVVQAVCCALLENHEKCGTPFIFAANGSRLRVYSPEKCATRQRSGILRSSRPKHPERPPKWHCSSAPRLHIALGTAAYIVFQRYRRNRPAPHLCPNLRRQTTSTFVCRHYLAPKRMLTSSLTARAKAAFFESCVYLSVVTVTPEGGAANRFQDFVPFKSSCYFLSGGPLLEEHEKCGTPFIFAANGSRLRVYSPEKCATRPLPLRP